MIGFFDSGKGGLTTLTDCINAGLCGEIIYYADYKNAPFGNKDSETLKAIGSNCVATLKRMGADTFVCACNTLSLACDFKEEKNVITLRIPFELIDDFSSCLFLGTDFSVKNLPKWFYNLGGKALALSELATLIDKEFDFSTSKRNRKNSQDGEADKNAYSCNEKIISYLSSELKGEYKTVVLGCTHYKFVRNEIKTLTNAKKILSVNIIAEQKTKSIKGDNLIVYLQKEKMEEYSSTLLSLTNKPIVKSYEI